MDALGVLNGVLELSSHSNSGSILRKNIAHQLGIRDLPALRSRVVTPGFLTGDYAKFVVEVLAPNETQLYLAVLTLTDRVWTLTAFMRMCQVCKGSQDDVNANPCRYCCATGWGEEDVWRHHFFSRWAE